MRKLKRLSMAVGLASVVGLFSTTATSAATWLTSSSCATEIQESVTTVTCPIWFEGKELVTNVSVAETDYVSEQSYTAVDDAASAAIVASVSTFSEAQLRFLQQALSGALDTELSVDLGVYQLSSELEALAALGATESQLSNSVWSVNNKRVVNAPSQLSQLVAVLGSQINDRSVMLLVSSGFELSEAQANELTQRFEQKEARLVFVQLATSELAANQFLPLVNLAQTTGGYHVLVSQSQWAGAFEHALKTTQNGGVLAFKIDADCGAYTIDANGMSGEQTLTSTLDITLPSCPEPEPEPIPEPEPEEQATPEPELEDLSSHEESLPSDEVIANDETQDTDLEELEEGVEGAPQGEDTPDGEVNSEEQDMPVDDGLPDDPNAEQSENSPNTIVVIAVASVLLLVLVLLVVVVLRRNKQAPAKVSMPSSDTSVPPPAVSMSGNQPASLGKPKLTINDTQQQTVVLTQKLTMVGRSSECNVVLTNDTVSTKHCGFRIDGQKLTVVDLSSTNGTKVNGSLITEAVLKDGDVLMLGEVQVTVSLGGE